MASEPEHTTDSLTEKDVKAPNLIERAKEEMEAVLHPQNSPHHHHHHKETHGHSDDIDENTPVDEVKAPGLLQRAKEEVEALVEAIHPKKESPSHHSTPKKDDGFFASIGKKLEKICSPKGKPT